MSTVIQFIHLTMTVALDRPYQLFRAFLRSITIVFTNRSFKTSLESRVQKLLRTKNDLFSHFKFEHYSIIKLFHFTYSGFNSNLIFSIGLVKTLPEVTKLRMFGLTRLKS